MLCSNGTCWTERVGLELLCGEFSAAVVGVWMSMDPRRLWKLCPDVLYAFSKRFMPKRSSGKTFSVEFFCFHENISGCIEFEADCSRPPALVNLDTHYHYALL